MLSRKRTPRTADERMILGNFRMMQFAWKKRNQPLDCDLIRELHHCGVQEIDDAKYKPGQFRTSDEVVVVDQDDQIVHQPPAHKELEQRLQQLCAWVNNDGDPSSLSANSVLKIVCRRYCSVQYHA